MIEINGKKFYTTKEVAEKLGFRFRTIQGWVKTGKLKPLRFGPKKFYFDEQAIEDCLRGQ